MPVDIRSIEPSNAMPGISAMHNAKKRLSFLKLAQDQILVFLKVITISSVVLVPDQPPRGAIGRSQVLLTEAPYAVARG